MIRLCLVCSLALLLAVGSVSAVGHAAVGCQVRVLDQGDSWQVDCKTGQYAYEIEYLDGDMFVTVEAQFLNDDLQVVHTTTHTLVEDTRMTAQRTFAPDRIVEGAKASAIRFQCGSGKARISFGPADKLNS